MPVLPFLVVPKTWASSSFPKPRTEITSPSDTVRSGLVQGRALRAQAIVHKAEERARILVSESEIVKNAQQRASEIMAQAQAESRTLRQTTADYCDNMLKTTEETMISNVSQIKSVRANLRTPPKKQQQ